MHWETKIYRTKSYNPNIGILESTYKSNTAKHEVVHTCILYRTSAKT